MSPIQLHPRQLDLIKLSGSHIRREGALPDQKLGVTSGSSSIYSVFLSDGAGGAYWGNMGGEFAHKITVFHYDGSPAEFFEVTDAGWDLAAAECSAYDTMVSPPAVYSTSHTVPNQVAYLGAGTLSTRHTGKVTIGAGCYIRDINIVRSANDENDLDGMDGPSSGESYLNTVNITVTQLGAGNANAINLGVGTLKTRECYLRAIVDGAGRASGLSCSGDGIAWLQQSEMIALAGETGTAYGCYRTLGTVYIIGGQCIGTTAPTYSEA